MMIQRILVPVDFGEASAAAVALAGQLAAGTGATMTLLHAEAIEAPVYFTSEQVDSLASERRHRQEQALRYLGSFGRTHTATPFDARIVMRPPVEAIGAEAVGTDLVVLGTHGRRGPKLWWLGSVAERVLRDLATPVLVVHASDAAPGPVTSVAVHAAPGLTGLSALALATRVGQALGVDVHDRRTSPVEPGAMFTDGSMVVVAEPQVHDRLWRTTVGEPLIRSGRGPVLFVPERT